MLTFALLFTPNFAGILIWVLILAIFCAVLWYIIGLLPAEFQRWAKVIAIVLVGILLIYWLSGLAPNPFR